MPFARGFKTRCENIAQSIRLDLGRGPGDPLPVTELADYLGVRIITPYDIPGMSEESLRALLNDECNDWSALTIAGSDATFVIYNPTNSPKRRSSDVAHELAHLLLRHSPSTMMFAPDGTWTLRSYDGQQEEEAAWLSGCLLLPRPALLRILQMNLSPSEAATRYEVSDQLFRFRKDITGVTRQMGSMRGGLEQRVVEGGLPTPRRFSILSMPPGRNCGLRVLDKVCHPP